MPTGAVPRAGSGSAPGPGARWSGALVLRPGIGVFKGEAGDNRAHRHWAHQLVIALDRGAGLSIDADPRRHRLAGAFIAAGTAHRLAPATVLSVYLDATTALARAVHDTLGGAPGLVALPASLAVTLRDCFDGPHSLVDGVALFHAAFGRHAGAAADPRLGQVLAALRRDVHDADVADRASLAALCGLSESRFSHWFRERSGMPLRSYRKWLRLIHGLEQALGPRSLTDAAHLARFADQAHFTRTFVDMFGVRPSDALAHLRAGARPGVD